MSSEDAGLANLMLAAGAERDQHLATVDATAERFRASVLRDEATHQMVVERDRQLVTMIHDTAHEIAALRQQNYSLTGDLQRFAAEILRLRADLMRMGGLIDELRAENATLRRPRRRRGKSSPSDG